MRQRFGFTLAEVLITLGVIGVVVALTIPTLIQNANERSTVSQLKKIYSTLSNAYTLAVQENGTPDTWGLANGAYPLVLGKLAPYLRVDKDCTDGSSGCFPPLVYYKYLATSRGNEVLFDTNGWPKLKLADGMNLSGWVYSNDCSAHWGTSLALQNVCGQYRVDVNGYKDPNQIGKDMFLFYLTKYGIIPFGTANDATFIFSSHCKDKDSMTGWSCAAWVIYNENMDYQRCDGLAWGVKTECD